MTAVREAELPVCSQPRVQGADAAELEPQIPRVSWAWRCQTWLDAGISHCPGKSCLSGVAWLCYLIPTSHPGCLLRWTLLCSRRKPRPRR